MYQPCVAFVITKLMGYEYVEFALIGIWIIHNDDYDILIMAERNVRQVFDVITKNDWYMNLFSLIRQDLALFSKFVIMKYRMCMKCVICSPFWVAKWINRPIERLTCSPTIDGNGKNCDAPYRQKNCKKTDGSQVDFCTRNVAPPIVMIRQWYS